MQLPRPAHTLAPEAAFPFPRWYLFETRLWGAGPARNPSACVQNVMRRAAGPGQEVPPWPALGPYIEATTNGGDAAVFHVQEKKKLEMPCPRRGRGRCRALEPDSRPAREHFRLGTGRSRGPIPRPSKKKSDGLCSGMGASGGAERKKFGKTGARGIYITRPSAYAPAIRPKNPTLRGSGFPAVPATNEGGCWSSTTRRRFPMRAAFQKRSGRPNDPIQGMAQPGQRSGGRSSNSAQASSTRSRRAAPRPRKASESDVTRDGAQRRGRCDAITKPNNPRCGRRFSILAGRTITSKILAKNPMAIAAWAAKRVSCPVPASAPRPQRLN